MSEDLKPIDRLTVSLAHLEFLNHHVTLHGYGNHLEFRLSRLNGVDDRLDHLATSSISSELLETVHDPIELLAHAVEKLERVATEGSK